MGFCYIFFFSNSLGYLYVFFSLPLRDVFFIFSLCFRNKNGGRFKIYRFFWGVCFREKHYFKFSLRCPEKLFLYIYILKETLEF